MGPKASHIKKKYMEDADTMNAYVKFENVEEAQLALEKNGCMVGGKTLRVSKCMEKTVDTKSTIFVGNLPFNLSQEDFRGHFKDIGGIQNLRLIKNGQTHQGIGIGYVRFSREEGKGGFSQK